MEIRPAREKDISDIRSILKELEMDYPIESFDNFKVIVVKDEIAGAANLEEFDDFLFLSAFGIKPSYRRMGIASSFLNDLLANAKKNIYLYTTIPEFFGKFGFETTRPISNLPKKDKFCCHECTPETCLCMVRKISGS